MSVRRRIIGEYMARAEGKKELRCDLCDADVVVHLSGRVKGSTKARHLCASCWQSEYERGAICIPCDRPPPRARGTLDPEEARKGLLVWADGELLMYGNLTAEGLTKAKNEVRAGMDEARKKHAGDPAAETEAMVDFVRNFLTAKIRNRCTRCGSKAVASFTDTTTSSHERLCEACARDVLPGLGKDDKGSCDKSKVYPPSP
jgi:transposase-like protein